MKDVSLSLIRQLEWPQCLVCNGPLLLSQQYRPEVRMAGECNLPHSFEQCKVVHFTVIESHFYCTLCAEYHEALWYFFYDQDGRRFWLEQYSFSEIRAPRVKRMRTNPDTQLMRS